MHRQMGQPSLAESLLPRTLGRNERLERIGEEVDWERFAVLVDGVYSADEGRPSYPPLMMVKVLLLEQCTTFPTRRWRRHWETAYRSVDSWDWDFRTRLLTTRRSAVFGRSCPSVG